MENLSNKQQIQDAKDYCIQERRFVLTALGSNYKGDLNVSNEVFREILLQEQNIIFNR